MKFDNENKIVADAEFYSKEQFIARCIREYEEENFLIKSVIKEDTYQKDTCAFRMNGVGQPGYVLGSIGRGAFKVHTVEYETHVKKPQSSNNATFHPETFEDEKDLNNQEKKDDLSFLDKIKKIFKIGG
jgi:hypothetical protein